MSSKRNENLRIGFTRDYSIFVRNNYSNRPLDIKRHRKLEESMKKYGFLRCFPIVCTRNENNKLVVKDGQHRLALAETLGLVVHWVVEDVDFDIAIVNSAAKGWVLMDYARKYSDNGLQDYVEGLAFAERHRLPLGKAFAMLAGVTGFNAISDSFQSGDFKVKDREWAEMVAGIYVPTVAMSRAVANEAFLSACMAVCRVKEFDAKRWLRNADRSRDRLVSYSKSDTYLTMMEEVYNSWHKQLFGLKSAAIMAMRERNPCIAKQIKQAASGPQNGVQRGPGRPRKYPPQA